MTRHRGITSGAAYGTALDHHIVWTSGKFVESMVSPLCLSNAMKMVVCREATHYSILASAMSTLEHALPLVKAAVEAQCSASIS